MSAGAQLAAMTTDDRFVVVAMAVNFLLIFAGSRALSDRGNLPAATGLFFAYLTTLIVVLYDTYRVMRAARERSTPLPRPGAR